MATKITIEQLAKAMNQGFKETREAIKIQGEDLRKTIKESIEELAGMTARGFNDVVERFNKIEERLEKLEQGNALGHQEIKSEIRSLKHELSQKPSTEELNELDKRLTTVEIKVRKLETVK